VIAVTVTLTLALEVFAALVVFLVLWFIVAANWARQEERADQKHYRKWWAPVDPKTAQRLRDGEL